MIFFFNIFNYEKNDNIFFYIHYNIYIIFFIIILHIIYRILQLNIKLISIIFYSIYYHFGLNYNMDYIRLQIITYKNRKMLAWINFRKKSIKTLAYFEMNLRVTSTLKKYRTNGRYELLLFVFTTSIIMEYILYYTIVIYINYIYHYFIEPYIIWNFRTCLRLYYKNKIIYQKTNIKTFIHKFLYLKLKTLVYRQLNPYKSKHTNRFNLLLYYKYFQYKNVTKFYIYNVLLNPKKMIIIYNKRSNINNILKATSKYFYFTYYWQLYSINRRTNIKLLRYTIYFSIFYIFYRIYKYIIRFSFALKIIPVLLYYGYHIHYYLAIIISLIYKQIWFIYIRYKIYIMLYINMPYHYLFYHKIVNFLFVKNYYSNKTIYKDEYFPLRQTSSFINFFSYFHKNIFYIYKLSNWINNLYIKNIKLLFNMLYYFSIIKNKIIKKKIINNFSIIKNNFILKIKKLLSGILFFIFINKIYENYKKYKYKLKQKIKLFIIKIIEKIKLLIMKKFKEIEERIMDKIKDYISKNLTKIIKKLYKIPPIYIRLYLKLVYIYYNYIKKFIYWLIFKIKLLNKYIKKNLNKITIYKYTIRFSRFIFSTFSLIIIMKYKSILLLIIIYLINFFWNDKFKMLQFIRKRILNYIKTKFYNYINIIHFYLTLMIIDIRNNLNYKIHNIKYYKNIKNIIIILILIIIYINS